MPRLRKGEILRQTFKLGKTIVRESLLPDRLPYMNEGWRVVGMEVMAGGVMDDGREFQEVRIYTRRLPSSKTTPLESVNAQS